MDCSPDMFKTSHHTYTFHGKMRLKAADRSSVPVIYFTTEFLQGKPRAVFVREGGNASLSMKEIYGRNDGIVVGSEN
jgi:hypothetical protein